MDERKMNTAEEEAYLRMLDREVPDLWDRIEAGLDRVVPNDAMYGQTMPNDTMYGQTAPNDMVQGQNGYGNEMTREQRFLAETESEAQILQFRPKQEGKKKKGWIIGVAVAAAALLISLAVFGLPGRTEKTEKYSSDESGQASAADRKDELSGESAKSYSGAEKLKDPTMSGTNNLLPNMGIEMDDAAEIEGEKKEAGRQGSKNERNEESEKMTEAAAEAAEETPDDGQGPEKIEPEQNPPATDQDGFVIPGKTGERTLMQLALMETPSVLVRIYRNINGTDVPFRIYGQTPDGEVLLLEEEIYTSDISEEEKKAKTTILDGETRATLRTLDGSGETVYSVP